MPDYAFTSPFNQMGGSGHLNFQFGTSLLMSTERSLANLISNGWAGKSGQILPSVGRSQARVRSPIGALKEPLKYDNG